MYDAGSLGSKEVAEKFNSFGFADPYQCLNPEHEGVCISLCANDFEELMGFYERTYPKSGGLQTQRTIVLLQYMLYSYGVHGNFVPVRIEYLLSLWQVGYKKAVISSGVLDRIGMDSHLIRLFRLWKFVCTGKRKRKDDKAWKYPESQAEAWIDEDLRSRCNNNLVTMCQMLQKTTSRNRNKNADMKLVTVAIEMLKEIHAADSRFHHYVEKWRVEYGVTDEEWSISGPSGGLFQEDNSDESDSTGKGSDPISNGTEKWNDWYYKYRSKK